MSELVSCVIVLHVTDQSMKRRPQHPFPGFLGIGLVALSGLAWAVSVWLVSRFIGHVVWFGQLSPTYMDHPFGGEGALRSGGLFSASQLV